MCSARARLDATLEQLRRDGEPVYPADLTRPPVPAEDNAAFDLRAAALLIDTTTAAWKNFQSAQPDDPVWPRRVTWALVLELSVFVVFAVVWEVTLHTPDAAVHLALLMLSAVALGVQSSAIQRFGVSGLSSTYLTGTLTSLIAGVAARSPWASLRPKAQVLLALMVGAAVGALVAVHLPVVAPALLIVPLLLVIAVSARMRA